MAIPITSLSKEKLTFVENLHGYFLKQARKTIEEQNKIVTLAKSYLKDGLRDEECVELLIIDGLSREAAENFTSMASNKLEEQSDGLTEYSFQFEDIYGKVWSSHDINKIIRAGSNKEAWEEAERYLDSQANFEVDKIISVNELS